MEESIHVKVPAWLKERLTTRSKKMGVSRKNYILTALLAFEAVQEHQINQIKKAEREEQLQ